MCEGKLQNSPYCNLHAAYLVLEVVLLCKFESRPRVMGWLFKLLSIVVVGTLCFYVYNSRLCSQPNLFNKTATLTKYRDGYILN
jgi:hypothetical protein